MNKDEVTEKVFKLTQLWEGCRKDSHSFISIIAQGIDEYKEVGDYFSLKLKDDLYLDMGRTVKDNIKDMIDFNTFISSDKTKFIFIPKNDFTKDLMTMIKKYDENGKRK